MAGEVEPGAYKDVVLFLATAGVVVPIFRRWKLSPILGFLGAGVLLGPHGLGRFTRDVPWLSSLTIENPAEVAQLAEFGVVFLLFMIGLELSWERLRRMRRYVFGLGGLQVAVCMTITAGLALAAGQKAGAAIAIGAAMALSSTAIVMPILTEQKRQHSLAGRTTFAVLLFQDLAVAPILVGVTLRLDEAVIFEAELGTGMAANPMLFFPLVLPTRAGTLVVDWVDDQGRSGSLRKLLIYA